MSIACKMFVHPEFKVSCFLTIRSLLISDLLGIQKVLPLQWLLKAYQNTMRVNIILNNYEACQFVS